jgi:hypothetical protein
MQWTKRGKLNERYLTLKQFFFKIWKLVCTGINASINHGYEVIEKEEHKDAA